MDTIKCNQQLSEKQFVSLMQFTTFGIKRFSKIIVFFITPSIGVLYLTFLIVLKEMTGFTIALALILILFPFLFSIIFSAMCKRLYRMSPSLQEKSEIVFANDYIESETELGASKHLYSELSKVYETKEFFVIYVKKLEFVGISKENIGDSFSSKISLKLQSEIKKRYISRT